MKPWPAASEPGVNGNGTGYLPVRWYTSMKLTPMAVRRTKASPVCGAGLGISVYRNASVPPYAAIWMAFMGWWVWVF